jgi:tetraacyldisaccharide 4'-kinase
MRAPGFWEQNPPSPLARLLLPIGALYGGIAAQRMRRIGTRVDLPIICIGNFTAGGAGKTPTAMTVAGILAAAGESPAFLSRGYGGRLAGPVQVELHHTASDVGDEPLLLAALAPAIVSRRRPSGAHLAGEIGATVIVMDDGLQNSSLAKDCAIAVVDGAAGIGNGLVLPAGPLRAPMEVQWPAVDAVLVIGDGDPGLAVAKEAERHGKPVFTARLEPDEAVVDSLRGKRLLAFAGIGRPEKFFSTLREKGLTIERAMSFPDHHAFRAEDIGALKSEAERCGLQPVTTEKDMARISSTPGLPSWPDLMALPVHLRLAEAAAFRQFILRRVGDWRIGRP